jgi:surface antigen
VRWRTVALAGWGLAVLLSLPAPAAARHSATSHKSASRSAVSHGSNCVAYAKAVTGIKIDGNAGLWWSHAAGRYDRGQEPRVGSVLVFKSFGHMRSGHVAVVSGVDGPRRILVDHANWVRGRISKAMAVVDTSSKNDWTSVKVLGGGRPEAGGQRDNPTFGFIYPPTPPTDFGTAVAKATPSHHKVVHIAARGHHKKADDAKLAYVY